MIFKGLVVVLAFLAAGCISERPGVIAPADIIHFPIGVAVHPGGRYAAVVNGNFNQAYRNGSVVVVDLSTYQIVPQWTLPVGSFAGEVIFNRAGTRLFVAVRGPFYEEGDYPDEPADVLVAIDVDLSVATRPPGGSPFFVAGSRRAISVAPDPFGLAVDYDDRFVYVSHISGGQATVLQDDLARLTDPEEQAAAEADDFIRRCVPENLSCIAGQAEGALCGACETNADCGSTEYVVPGGAGGLPKSEPNTCIVDPRRLDTRYCATFCEVDRTALDESGAVSRLGCPAGYRCEEIRPMHYVTERVLARGGNQIAVSPATGSVYVTARDSNFIGVLRPFYEEGLGFRFRTEQRSFSDGFDLRGLAFNDDGSRLFIADRGRSLDAAAKPGVLILDTTLTSENCTADQLVGDSTLCERNELADVIEVNDAPANVAFVDDFLYAPMFSSDELFAIDTRTREVTAVVNLAPENFIEEVGIFRENARPYDLATFSNSAGRWALVSHFAAHEVSVIQLFDAEGDPVNRLVRKIENRAKLYEEDQF